jgi:ferredoxin/flavodoxin---NADP+ reductase
VINEQDSRYFVAIIGAGPAGLFAARELAGRGIHTILFNRDIKPGGLAEYGIYPTKIRMKEGLRNQFRQILESNNISYYGNVQVGAAGDLTLDDLREMGFQALLVTVGAQSTKRLQIPGEDLIGVYHAKDIVYHYNVLPPFSEATFQIGKRVAVVGAGNVMMDITRWLIEEKNVESVIAVARRGPAEVKFDRKELESIVGYLNVDALENELQRVIPIMQEIGQDTGSFRAMIQDATKKAAPVINNACFSLRFLASPDRILGDEHGQMVGLRVEENTLLLGEDGQSRARGTGQYDTLAVDTVIFAIGDVVDSSLGLPVEYGEFVKNPQPRFPVEGISYEAFDPQTGQVIQDVFLSGWARRPSVGLVGTARKDGTNAAQVISQYLQTLPPSTQPVIHQVQERLRLLSRPLVDKEDLFRLNAVERERASELNLPYYKFTSNQQMLEALGLISSQK